MKVQKELGDRLGSDVHMVSITLDAEVDTPGKLASYRESYGVGPGWTFYTGDYDEIEVLRHKLGAFDPDPIVDQDKTQHAGLLICGNEPKGRWMAIPAQLSVKRLVRTVDKVLR